MKPVDLIQILLSSFVLPLLSEIVFSAYQEYKKKIFFWEGYNYEDFYTPNKMLI